MIFRVTFVQHFIEEFERKLHIVKKAQEMEQKIKLYFCIHRWRCSIFYARCFNFYFAFGLFEIGLENWKFNWFMLWFDKKRVTRRFWFLAFSYRLDCLTSGLLLFGRNPKKAREMEQHIQFSFCNHRWRCSSFKMFWFLICFFLSIWNRVAKLEIYLIHVVIWQKKSQEASNFNLAFFL